MRFKFYTRQNIDVNSLNTFVHIYVCNIKVDEAPKQSNKNIYRKREVDLGIYKEVQFILSKTSEQRKNEDRNTSTQAGKLCDCGKNINCRIGIVPTKNG